MSSSRRTMRLDGTSSLAALLRNANALLHAGKHDAALQAYESLSERSEALRATLAPNLEMARNAIASDPSRPAQSAQPEGLPADAPRDASPAAKPVFLSDIYASIDKALADKRVPHFKRDEAPLVSVIVTAHDTEIYIEECIESLLSQSYPHLEVIVVDDASNDATPAIARRIGRSNGAVRVFQLNANLGTYYAKNLGILRARGEVIFFQDSDDICHPHRIAVQMQRLLSQRRASIVRGAYCRVDPDTERVVPVNGLTSKLGLITLGVRREVFNRIGFFNCTTKASDDEFLQRAQHYLGKAVVVDEQLPLYYNTLRDGSLFADMVSWRADGSIEQKPSPVREAYVKTFQQAHTEQDVTQARQRFAFPRIRDALPVFPEMTKLANPEVPVVVGICSIPEREASLRRTLRSIAPQCDRIHLYLDRYETVPAFLQDLPVPVHVVRSQDVPGLRDNGKFIELDRLSKAGEDAYYLTTDDDIEYPPDYVNTMIKALQSFDDQVVVGVHGVTLQDEPKGYYTSRRMVHAFWRELERPRLVNVLGTGTTAFRAANFPGFSLDHFAQPGMADLYLARECQRRGVAMVCVARPEAWLKDLGRPGSPTLFDEFRLRDLYQAELLVASGPWGLSGIEHMLKLVQQRNAQLGSTLQKLLPLLRGVTQSIDR
jgi:glycosyltransferase involved in cell wall biosynthesis